MSERLKSGGFFPFCHSARLYVVLSVAVIVLVFFIGAVLFAENTPLWNQASVNSCMLCNNLSFHVLSKLEHFTHFSSTKAALKWNNRCRECCWHVSKTEISSKRSCNLMGFFKIIFGLVFTLRFSFRCHFICSAIAESGSPWWPHTSQSCLCLIWDCFCFHTSGKLMKALQGLPLANCRTKLNCRIFNSSSWSP